MSETGSTRKTVGVLGGMGPDATVDFFAKLVAASHAERDQDHLRVVIDNDPSVPDRTAAVLGRGPSPAPRLAAMARGLVAQGAEVLVMPCNAAHAFVNAVREGAGDVPFIDLIETTVTATLTRHPSVLRVGLLATDATIAAHLYENAYATAGVEALVPNPEDQKRVMAAIYEIKRGRQDRATSATLQDVATALVRAGAGAIVAACTEVPLALRDPDVVVDGRRVPLIASTDELVARTVAFATGR